MHYYLIEKETGEECRLLSIDVNEGVWMEDKYKSKWQMPLATMIGYYDLKYKMK